MFWLVFEVFWAFKATLLRGNMSVFGVFWVLGCFTEVLCVVLGFWIAWRLRVFWVFGVCWVGFTCLAVSGLVWV